MGSEQNQCQRPAWGQWTNQHHTAIYQNLSTKTYQNLCCGRVFVPPEGNSDCCFCHSWRTTQREPGRQKASTPLPISKSHQHKLTQQPLEQRIMRLHFQRTLMRLLPSTVATSTLGTLRTSTMALTRPISQSSCGWSPPGHTSAAEILWRSPHCCIPVFALTWDKGRTM